MSGRKGAVALEAFALFALAFALRALAWPRVVGPGGVQGLEPDAWYHLRRIAYALRNPGRWLDFDPLLNFPEGARAIWPPLFDAVLAMLLRPVVGGSGSFGAEEALRLEQWVVWAPPLIGGLTVVTTWGLARRHFGRPTAVVAGLLLAWLPAAAWYGRIGAVDHHVAVAFASAALLGAGMQLVRAGREESSLVRPAVALGLLQGVMLLLWPGGLLQVGLVGLGVAIYWVTRPSRAEAARFGLALAGACAIALGLSSVFGVPEPPLPGGPFAPTVASRFQPLLFALGVAVPLSSLLLWRITRPDTVRVRALQATVLALLLAALAWACLPGLASGLADAWSWLARAERFQGSVIESRPLLLPEGRLDLLAPAVWLSAFVYLAPFVGLGFVVREWRGPRRAERLLLALFGLGLAVATAVQARFFNSLSIPLAILFAGAVEWARRGLVTRVEGSPPGRVSLALAAGVAVLLVPTVGNSWRDATIQWAHVRGEPLPLTGKDRYWRSLDAVARWLRDNTRAPGDPWDAASRPTWGVLGHWQYGHPLLYRSQRPTVVGNFGDDVPGDNYRLSFEYFRASEEEAVELLDGLRARYVVIRPLDVARGSVGGDAILDRFADPDGGDARHHRLVFEQRVLPSPREAPRAQFRVFERVAGASVEGRAAPGETVEATLGYRSPTGRRGRFRQRARVDATGRYALRLPYATRGAPTGLELEEAWVLHAPGSKSTGRLVVEEQSVREGDRLRGPDLRSSSLE